MWDSIIYDALTQENIVIPPKTESTKDQQYAGAYVKEPTPGVYDWVVNFDLNSLYPHLIMQYNISPETLLDDRVSGINVDKLLNREIDTSTLEGVTICPNGTLFTTEKQGFLPKLMEKIIPSVLSTRRRCSRRSKSMRILKILNSLRSRC